MTTVNNGRRKRICVVTGTRAEYGLLKWTMKALADDPDVELRVVATGAHLSPEFGLTWRHIEADGFKVDRKVEMLLSADTATSVARSTGLAVLGFVDAFEQLAPDVVLLLGDRYEVLAVASVAMLMRIPIAHVHGGEVTQGALDDSIRHAVTKLSHVHFTTTESYRQRILQLGEDPALVFNVGSPGVECIRKLPRPTREEWAKRTGFRLGDSNLAVTFHPETLASASPESQFQELLLALSRWNDSHTIVFTRPNADEGGRILNDLIDSYVAAHPQRAAVFGTLGSELYFGLLAHSSAVVGNSSSGLIEAPSLNVPTVDIGDRQRGRMRGNSVFSCDAQEDAIVAAIESALAFGASGTPFLNPYDGGGSPSLQITKVLKSLSPSEILVKRFHDLSTTAGIHARVETGKVSL